MYLWEYFCDTVCFTSTFQILVAKIFETMHDICSVPCYGLLLVGL